MTNHEAIETMSFVYHFGAITLFLIAFIIATLLIGIAYGCHGRYDINWKDAFLGAYITATLIALGLYIILMSATGKWDLPKNSNIVEVITEESNDDEELNNHVNERQDNNLSKCSIKEIFKWLQKECK